MKRRRKRKKLTAEQEQAKIDAYLSSQKPGTLVTICPTKYASGADRGPTAKPRGKQKKD